MAIDRGQYHFEDAGSWEAACRHIGVFVAWAAKRGLLELRDELAAITRAPTRYVIDHLDCSLLDDNLTDEGARFAQVAYRRFLREYNTTAVELDVEVYRVPERHPEITMHMERWLDAQLAAWREA